jgi:16S rRNA (uracil1498-N3)-methyltransferase
VHARFYAPDAHEGASAALPDDEAQHLARVLRLKPGDAIVVFNGRGGEFAAAVESIGASRVQVKVGAPLQPAPEPRIAITLAQAVLKGDKMDDVIRDAVMVGVAAIQPIITTRTEVSRQTLDRAHRRERWARIAVSSAKQCGRAVVPPVLDPIEFDELPAAISSLRLPGPALMLVEPRAAAETIGLGELDGPPPAEATIVVGPEGGWTPEELVHAATACRLMTMGGRTIRSDAMAVMAIAALFARWGEF